MSRIEWYNICIKDYLIASDIIKETDNIEINLYTSDCRFRIDIHFMENSRRVRAKTIKGSYTIDDDYINLNNKESKWKIKV